MKKVYLIKKDTYISSQPVMAFDNYNDAVHAAASFNDDDDDRGRELVSSVPYCTTEPTHVDTQDLGSVIDMTIKATLAGMDALEKRGGDE